MAEGVILSEGRLLGASTGEVVDLDLTEGAVDARLDLTGAQHGDLLWVDTSGDEPVIRRGASLGLLAGFRDFFNGSHDTGVRGVFDGLNAFAVQADEISFATGAALLEDQDPEVTGDPMWPAVLPSVDNIYDMFDAPHATLDRIDLLYVGVDRTTGEAFLAVVTGTPDASPVAPNEPAEGLDAFPWLRLQEVTIPADEPDATAWTFTDVRLMGTLVQRVGSIRVMGKAPGGSHQVFNATGSGVDPDQHSVGFFSTGYLTRTALPTIDPTSLDTTFGAPELAALQALVNLMIAIGLVIDGTP